MTDQFNSRIILNGSVSGNNLQQLELAARDQATRFFDTNHVSVNLGNATAQDTLMHSFEGTVRNDITYTASYEAWIPDFITTTEH